jgi:CubicO group peptidase (beta-lactamase class C family)
MPEGRDVIACLLLAATLPDTKLLDADVAQAMKHWRVPGLAVVVIAGDEVFVRGYGVRKQGEAGRVDADTLFSFASCSKGLTVLAMADLVAEKKLTWDDPVRKHLKEFNLADPLAARDVTLRDLLTHRTGLGGHELLWYRSPFSPLEAVQAAGKLPLDQPFRTTFSYQNTMYTAAGLAAARADGRLWTEMIRTRVLKPLKMDGTMLDTASAEKTGRLACTHQLDEDESIVARAPFRWAEPNPAGSVYVSASDLSKWLRFQISGDARLKEVHTPQIVLRDGELDPLLFPHTVQRTYGLGWVIYDHHGQKTLAHGGALDGFRCHVTLIPGKKLAVGVLANLDQTPACAALCARLLDRLLKREPEDWNARLDELRQRVRKARREAFEAQIAEASRGKPLEPAGYAGDYTHPAYGPARIRVKEGVVRFRWREEEGTLEPLGTGTFLFRGDTLGLSIVTFRERTSFTVSTIPGITFRRGAP